MEHAKIRWNGWGWTAHEESIGEAVWSRLASELGMPALLATPARALEEIALLAPRLKPGQRARLAELLGLERVRDDNHARALHAFGRSYHDLIRLRAGELAPAPDAVLYPRGPEEVLAVLQYACDEGIAVVPFGGGTGVVGGANASAGSFGALVTLDLSGMNRILAIDAVSGTVTAEAGIKGPALEKQLQSQGLMLGHFPQSHEFSTLGGWIMHNGAGKQSGRYGSARDWLVGARLATPRGWLETGKFPASASGPDLNALVLGSEGTFGILTEATLRVRPLPEASVQLLYLFHDFASGTNAIRAARRAAIPTAMLRLSDASETRFVRAFGTPEAGRGLAVRLADVRLKLHRFDDNAASLIVGFAGGAQEIAGARKQFDALAAGHGARALGEKPAHDWSEMRLRAPYWRDAALDHGLGVETFETAASWSKLPALYAAVRTVLESATREASPRPGAHGIVLCHISHCYPDGANLYFTVLFARALGDEIAQWRKIKCAASDAILAHGGTISHHHGVGEDHLPWIAQEKSALGIEILRAIKHAVDPKGILNPGKLIP